MTPDPKIMNASTVAALMNVLRAAPYNLSVPKASDFPLNSELRAFWKLPITVKANEGGHEYVATSGSPWTIMPNIVINAPGVLLSAGSDSTSETLTRAPPRNRARRLSVNNPPK